MLKLWLTVLFVVSLDTLGDLLITSGMKRIGPLRSLQLSVLLPFLAQIATHPLLGLGLLSSIVSFLVYLWLLSWSQLSFAVPATALIFVLGTLGARFILRERIAKARWLGTLLIGLGVALISFD